MLTSLLRDRLKGEAVSRGQGEESAERKLLPRSIYRETLFLNMTVLASRLDIGMENHRAGSPVSGHVPRDGSLVCCCKPTL